MTSAISGVTYALLRVHYYILFLLVIFGRSASPAAPPIFEIIANRTARSGDL